MCSGQFNGSWLLIDLSSLYLYFYLTFHCGLRTMLLNTLLLNRLNWINHWKKNRFRDSKYYKVIRASIQITDIYCGHLRPKRSLYDRDVRSGDIYGTKLRQTRRAMLWVLSTVSPLLKVIETSFWFLNDHNKYLNISTSDVIRFINSVRVHFQVISQYCWFSNEVF